MAFTMVPGFVPSQNGFHFANDYSHGTPYGVATIPGLPPISLGDAGNGLCGGFVMAALDLFRHNPRLPPPANTGDADQPPPGSPIFDYLTRRLRDSFGELAQGDWGNALRVIDYIHTFDSDPQLGGLARLMVVQEWPKIKADIDSGLPSPLSLIGGQWHNTTDLQGTIDALHQCHQVLAYGYELDAAHNLKLLVYDCNDPSNDASLIELNIGDTTHAITISAPAVSSHLGAPIRAFFRPDYLLHDPSSIAGNQWRDVGHATDVVAMTAAQGTLFCATRGNRLLARPPVLVEAPWQDIGHANGVVGMAAIGNHLFCATGDGKLWIRDAVLADVRWQEIGHAYKVVGMAATANKLFCATSENKLWARDPVPTNVDWQEIGEANSVVAMAATPSTLFCATSDNRLWSRDAVLTNIAWKELDHADFVVGMAATGIKLFCATNQNKLWVRATNQ